MAPVFLGHIKQTSTVVKPMNIVQNAHVWTVNGLVQNLYTIL
jgi:hypothetical protein